MATRVVVAILAIPVIVFLAFAGGYPFYFLILIISSFALIEFYNLSRLKGAAPLRVLGVVTGMAVTSTFFYSRFLSSLPESLLSIFNNIRLPSQWQVLLIILILFVLLSLIIEIFRGRGSAIFNFSAALTGVLYVSLPFGTLIGIREVFGESILPARFLSLSGEVAGDTVYRWGGYTVISILACIWICDTAAQLVGLRYGRHKLSANVSPNKSWEGAISGFVAAILTAIVSRELVLPYLTLSEALVVGVVVGVVGQIGDLAESKLKRDANVKDSSQIIPGHGGVLDRFDSLLFVSPLLFLYFDFVIF